MEKIGIFCSASDSIDKIYFLKASEPGEWMAKAKNLSDRKDLIVSHYFEVANSFEELTSLINQ